MFGLSVRCFLLFRRLAEYVGNKFSHAARCPLLRLIVAHGVGYALPLVFFQAFFQAGYFAEQLVNLFFQSGDNTPLFYALFGKA